MPLVPAPSSPSPSPYLESIVTRMLSIAIDTVGWTAIWRARSIVVRSVGHDGETGDVILTTTQLHCTAQHACVTK